MKCFKHVAFLLLAMALYSIGQAQDIITTTQGKRVEAKVIEIGTYDVKYKDPKMPDGPTYVISRKEVSSITYADGHEEAAFPKVVPVKADVLITTNGKKMEVKVVEIGSYDIKYKDPRSPDGPTYMISRNEVVLISYADGHQEVITADPPSYTPEKTANDTKTKTESSSKKTGTGDPELDTYYAGKNVISLNSMALLNSDITLMYDREFAEGQFGITLFGGIHVNKDLNVFNQYLTISELSDARKKFDLGVAFNYYTSNDAKAQYFMGLMVKYMGYESQRREEYYETINGFQYLKYRYVKNNGFQLAYMFSNGVQVRVSPHFNFKLIAAVGTFTGDATLMKGVSSGLPAPKMYFGICYGYRF